MKLKLVILIFFSAFILKGDAQSEKAAIQIGASALPIFDVLKFFPENTIAGVAVSGNLGYLTIKNISIGIQPFYAEVSNSYNNTPANGGGRQKQSIKLYGLNTYIRYYFITKEKFLMYSQLSCGFGNFDQITSNIPSLAVIKDSHIDKSIFTTLLGVGVNYFVTKNFALELNAPFIYLKQISTDPNDKDFKTVAPTIGFQFYLK